MQDEKITVTLENGSSTEVVVFRKSAHSIEIVLGEGVHSVRCELTPTRNKLAYAGEVRGREVIYERSQKDVQADLDRVDPSFRQSRPRK